MKSLVFFEHLSHQFKQKKKNIYFAFDRVMGFEKFASRNREKSVGGRERKGHMVVWSKVSCQAAVIRLFF